MGVVSLTSNGLSDEDVSAVVGLSYMLAEKGIAGAGIAVEMERDGRMVAILDPSHQIIMLGFGRNSRGYYVFDCDGRPILENCLTIEDLLPLFRQ